MLVLTNSGGNSNLKNEMNTSFLSIILANVIKSNRSCVDEDTRKEDPQTSLINISITFKQSGHAIKLQIYKNT